MFRIFFFFFLTLPLHSEEVLHFYSSAPLSLEKNQLRDLYLGRIFDVDKVTVRPVVLPTGASHKALLKEVVFKTASQFKRHWKKMLFTGKASPPAEFDSEKGVFELLRSKNEEKGIWFFCSFRKEKPDGVFEVEVGK